MFNRRRRGLGAVTESTSEPWVRKLTKAGDTLTTLAAAYGVSAQEIVAQNGVPFKSDAINAWVQSIGGALLKSGWYVFTANTAILLPPSDRKDGEPEANATAAQPAASAPLTREEMRQRAVAAAALKIRQKTAAGTAAPGAPAGNGKMLVVALGAAAAAAYVMFKSKSAKDKSRSGGFER